MESGGKGLDAVVDGRWEMGDGGFIGGTQEDSYERRRVIYKM